MCVDTSSWRCTSLNTNLLPWLFQIDTETCPDLRAWSTAGCQFRAAAEGRAEPRAQRITPLRPSHSLNITSDKYF